MAREVKQENQVNKQPQGIYDPGKDYGWDPNTIISFTGMEFNILYNNLNSFIGGQITPVNIIKIADCFSVIQNKLVQMVNSGEIKEVTKE